MTDTTNQQRPTRTLTTPNNHEVVVYDYISGGELRKFQSLFLEDTTAAELTDEKGPSNMLARVTAPTMMRAQEMLLDMLVVSVDGQTENPKELVLALRPDDTDMVIATLDEYTTPAEGRGK